MRAALATAIVLFFALDMNPIQIQIGDLIAKSPDKEKNEKTSVET